MLHLILTLDSKNRVINPYHPLTSKHQEYRKCIHNIIGDGYVIVYPEYSDLVNGRVKVVMHETTHIDKKEDGQYNDLESAISKEGNTYILGNVGNVLLLHREKVSVVHLVKLTDIDYIYETKFLPELWPNFVMSECIGSYTTLTYTQFSRTFMGERQYLHIMEDILKNGEKRTGRNGGTLSTFGQHMKFDLRNGFPLLTTKKMFFRGIVEELLFFLRGETDSSKLEEKGIKIWTGNTTAEFLKSRGLDYAPGVMGPMYGSQWRNFGGKYNIDGKGRPIQGETDGIDQLANVIELIRTDPTSRRILMTDYNPKQAEEGVLYPCHSIVLQFYVQDGFLDMFCYNRSQDFFLGTPFNIASSSLLQIIIARVTGLMPRYFNLSMGDAHLYDSHIDAVKEQLPRFPYKFPEVRITKEISSVNDIEKLEYKDFALLGYISHPSIKAEMVA